YTERRHIMALGIEYIGKEANRLEEQLFLGIDEDAQIAYGLATANSFLEMLRQVCVRYGKNELAKICGLSSRHLTQILLAKVPMSHQVFAKLQFGVLALHRKDKAEKELISKVKEECARSGLRSFATQTSVDPTNLSKILNGRRTMSARIRSALERLLQTRTNELG